MISYFLAGNFAKITISFSGQSNYREVLCTFHKRFFWEIVCLREFCNSLEVIFKSGLSSRKQIDNFASNFTPKIYKYLVKSNKTTERQRKTNTDKERQRKAKENEKSYLSDLAAAGWKMFTQLVNTEPCLQKNFFKTIIRQ